MKDLCVVCMQREQVGSRLCDLCYKSLQKTEPSYESTITWAANRSRYFMARRKATRPAEKEGV